MKCEDRVKRGIGPCVGERIRNTLDKYYESLLYVPQWNIGIVFAPVSVFLQSNAKAPVHWFPQPERDKCLADPFAVRRNERLYILCEQFDYYRSKGRIVYFEVKGRNTPRDPQVAIDRPFHISYPYLFAYQGRVYCTPETAQAREIALYEAQDFPRDWAKTTTLVDDFAGLDPTLFLYEGRWWLASSNNDLGGSNNLYLWYATDLRGPWEPHTGNPVKRDISSSRPAGRPFTHRGCVYRPAQDCSGRYGRGVVLNRITILTPSEFKEEQAAMVEPSASGPYAHGLHTVSSEGNITLVDGYRFKFVRNFSELSHNAKSLFSMIRETVLRVHPY